MKKVVTYVAPLLVLAGLVGYASAARADDSSNTHTFSGTVSRVDAKTMTFALATPHSGIVMVKADGDTQFTDKDGSIRHWSDLSAGDKLKIKGDFSDSASSVDNVNQVIFRSDK
jgi:hypothetical protein